MHVLPSPCREGPRSGLRIQLSDAMHAFRRTGRSQQPGQSTAQARDHKVLLPETGNEPNVYYLVNLAGPRADNPDMQKRLLVTAR